MKSGVFLTENDIRDLKLMLEDYHKLRDRCQTHTRAREFEPFAALVMLHNEHTHDILTTSEYGYQLENTTESTDLKLIE